MITAYITCQCVHLLDDLEMGLGKYTVINNINIINIITIIIITHTLHCTSQQLSDQHNTASNTALHSSCRISKSYQHYTTHTASDRCINIHCQHCVSQQCLGILATYKRRETMQSNYHHIPSLQYYNVCSKAHNSGTTNCASKQLQL